MNSARNRAREAKLRKWISELVLSDLDFYTVRVALALVVGDLGDQLSRTEVTEPDSSGLSWPVRQGVAKCLWSLHGDGWLEYGRDQSQYRIRFPHNLPSNKGSANEKARARAEQIMAENYWPSVNKIDSPEAEALRDHFGRTENSEEGQA